MMKNKGKILGPLTGVAVALAVALGFFDNHGAEQTPLEASLLQDMNIPSIAQITISDEGRELNFQRTESGWELTSPAGLPVKFAQINRLLISLMRMKAVEPKTDNPGLYERLGLGADATKLRVGDDILYIGKSAIGGSSRRYVRLEGDARTYVADAVPDISWALKDWADLSIPNIAKARVKRISITHSDDEVTFTTSEPAGKVEMLLNEGEEMAFDSVGDALAGAFNYISFNAVKPVADVDFTDAIHTRYETWDGLSLDIAIAEVEGKKWVKFDVSYDAGALESGTTFPQAPADPEKEVESFKKLTTWAFELPDYKLTEMVKHRSDFLKEDEEL
jgi:hypothetical protein